MVLRAELLLVGWIILALPFASANRTGGAESEEPQAKAYKGILRHPVYALGGETTGTVIETEAGEYELDLGRQPGLVERVRSLANKPVVVTGTLTVRPGVEIKERRIVAVTELKADDQGRPKDGTKKDQPKGAPRGQGKPVKIEGTLRHPVDTGGESAGTLLETEADSYELDLGRQPGLVEKARSLANKPVVVTGTLTLTGRPGAEAEPRRIIAVTELKADDAR